MVSVFDSSSSSTEEVVKESLEVILANRFFNGSSSRLEASFSSFLGEIFEICGVYLLMLLI